MTAGELTIGARFRTLNRRRSLIKKCNSSRVLALPNGPFGERGALYVQHDEKGNPIHIPYVQARTSNGRVVEMKSTTEVIQLNPL